MVFQTARQFIARQLVRARPKPVAVTVLPGCSYYANFLTADEQAALEAAIKLRLKGTGYERDHWDAVIDRYREREMLAVDDEAADAVVERVRELLRSEHGVASFLPPHCIDLAEDGGIIRPHVDSVKFSGRVVAGLSLLSASTMVLAEADPETGAPRPGASESEVRLEPGSLYVLEDGARYDYAHAITPEGRRLSLILRDAPPDFEQRSL
jgi:alkylated DNA repair protein alkB family protein 7